MMHFIFQSTAAHPLLPGPHIGFLVSVAANSCPNAWWLGTEIAIYDLPGFLRVRSLGAALRGGLLGFLLGSQSDTG